MTCEVMGARRGRSPMRGASDLALSDPRVKDLRYFALLERGVYMARRGMVALSLPFGDAEVDRFVAALDDAVAVHAAALPTLAQAPGQNRDEEHAP